MRTKVVFVLPVLFLTAPLIIAQVPQVLSAVEKEAAQQITQTTLQAGAEGLAAQAQRAASSVSVPAIPVFSLADRSYFPTYAPAGWVGVSPVVSSPVAAPATHTPELKRSLWQKLTRGYRARQLHHQREQENLLRIQKAGLPQPLEHLTRVVNASELLSALPMVSIVEPPLLSFIMDKQQLADAVKISNPDIPLIPFVKEPGYAYRGMAVTPQDITNFFNPQIGMERRSTVASNRLNMTLAAGSHGAIKYFSTHPTINMTSVPLNAQFWGAKFLSTQKPILIIARVKGDFGSHAIINYQGDILAKDIDSVIALLEKDGSPCWFKIQPTADGQFQITPYEFISNP